MTLEVAAPRGDFVLGDVTGPVLLISAGIGVTPVLAMLHALAAGRSERAVWWIHGARGPQEHPLAAEAHALLACMPNAREHVFYSATAGQSVSVTAENTTTITGIAGALGATTGAAGIGASLDLEIISKQTFAYIAAGAVVAAGGLVNVSATSSETMLSVTATLGGGDAASGD